MNINDYLLNLNSPEQHKTSIESLAFLGDSWTDKYWLGALPMQYAKRPCPFFHWTSIVDRVMRIPTWNFGIGGDTAKNIAVGDMKRTQDVLDVRPSHVTVMLGANDIYQKSDLDSIMNWIDIIVTKMQANGIKVILMWYSLSPYGSPPAQFPIDVQWQMIKEMRTRTATYANAKGLTYIDFNNSKLWLGNSVDPQYYLPDLIHLNINGQRVVAEYLIPLINKGGI